MSAVKSVAPLAAVLALAVAVNWPTLNDYFHGDDYIAFIDMVTKPMWRHFEEAFFFKDSNVYWRPLGEIYYYLIWKVFGLDEVAFHVANLAVFLMTLVLLYAFCIRAGFGRLTATGACAFLTLFPNHVVSVAWTTNGPRLVAVAFALGSLVLLQQAIASRRWYWEVLAFLSFVLGSLADETALSLAPLALLYTLALDRERRGWVLRSFVRAVPYAALVLTLAPLQFLASAGSPGFNRIKFGWHMPENFWALISKLVWPVKDSVSSLDIAAEQWTAGGIAIGLTALAFVLGSNRLRFLASWIVLALAPFTIWMVPIAPARYVYMAAVPFAVVVAWAAASLFEWLRWTAPGAWIAGRRPAAAMALAVILAPLLYLGTIGAEVTRDRDLTFGRDAETYRILAEGLKESAPDVPEGARIVIYYGIWNTFYVWPDALAKTIYRDTEVRIVNVPRGQVEAGAPDRGPKDVVLFYTGKGFIRSAPIGRSGSAGQ